MAEKKIRILLRNDILTNWRTINPILGKGEAAVVFDPSATGEDRQIRLKIGDGATNFNDLPYVGSSPEVEQIIEQLQSDVAQLQTDITTKVEKELSGSNGTAYIFNESDGGGAKFVNNDGVESFVGVNDGGADGIAAQIYADKLVEGKWEGAKLDVTNGGIYYTVGSDSAADRDVPTNELAVKGDVNAVDEKVDALDSKLTNNYYTSAETDVAIASAIAESKHLTTKIVDVLPTPGPECENIIYLVPKGAGKTGYKEYMCFSIDGGWVFEEIGDTDIDLTEYRKAADQDVIDAKKVDKQIIGSKGTAEIFNESDGGGAKFTGTETAFIGVHDNIGGEIGVQAYVDNAAGTESTIIDITQNGAYYTKGTVLPGAQRDIEANEIVVKKDLDAKMDVFDIIDCGSASDWED